MYLNHSYHIAVKLNFRKIKNFKIFEDFFFNIFNAHQRELPCYYQEGFLKLFTLTGLQKCHKVIKTVHQHTVGTICVHTTFMIA